MSSLCKYGMCHNLGSSTYQGYCNKDHQKQALEKEILLKIVETHKEIATIKDARNHLMKMFILTSSFHCEVCKELLRE